MNPKFIYVPPSREEYDKVDSARLAWKIAAFVLGGFLIVVTFLTR